MALDTFNDNLCLWCCIGAHRGALPHRRTQAAREQLNEIMTIEIYEGYAFLIKDIKKLAKLYACVDCPARLTKPCDLQRHAKTCAQGKTVIDCPNERVEAPQTAYQRAFYGKSMWSPSSIRWIERISKVFIWEAHPSRSMWARWREMDRRRAFYDYATSTKIVF